MDYDVGPCDCERVLDRASVEHIDNRRFNAEFAQAVRFIGGASCAYGCHSGREQLRHYAAADNAGGSRKKDAHWKNRRMVT